MADKIPFKKRYKGWKGKTKNFILLLPFMGVIYEWFQVLFYIKIVNGGVHYVPSSTKAFLTFVRLLTLGMLATVLAAFMIKLGVNLPLIEEAGIAKTLTAGILASFTGLSGIISMLLGYLQKNYTEHKNAVKNNFKP